MTNDKKQEPPDGDSPTTEEVQIRTDLFKSLSKLDTELALEYEGETRIISAASRVLVLGRSRDCDLVVEERYASRIHARIVFRQGKFVLIDQSMNGTYVKPDTGSEVTLGEQEEYPLSDSGRISLGKPVDENISHVIHYRLQQAS